MPLETGTTISSLNASNPAATDGLGQADDHMRLIKSVLKTTFPNFAGVLAATEAQLDAVVSTMFSGTMHSFPKTRTDIASGGSGTTLTGKNFLECDGTTYLIANFPTLAAYLGTTYGGNGITTFGVPNLKDTGRFIRSRTASLAVGTTQSNTFTNHTHTASAATVTGTVTPSGVYTPAGSITHSISAKTRGDVVSGVPAAGQTNVSGAVTAAQSTGSDGSVIDITAGPTFNGTGTGCPFSFTFSGSAPNVVVDASTTGSTETRPEAFVAIIAIKT